MPPKIISTGAIAPCDDDSQGADLSEFAAAGETRELVVPEALHDLRIDRVLATLVPEFSRSYLQQMLADSAVQLNGRAVVKASLRVSAGARLRVELRPTPQAMAFVAQPMALDIVYEDADLMVVNKPAGLVVHPAAGHWSGTLLNGLLAYNAVASSLPRAGIVHRLDKDTSGLMVVAKTRMAMDALVRLIAAREVHREYLAVAHGTWREPLTLDVDRPIGRDPVHRLRMAVLGAASAGAKPARTTVRVLEQVDGAVLVSCQLHTGRTHQIRVHMGSLGHPLVGDGLYGGRPLFGLERQALHATWLRFAHPINGRPLSFFCVPPQDFLMGLQRAGFHYNPGQSGAV